MQDDAVPGATGELAYEIPTVHFACMYQPLDEIRDYFGDDNAIYFSWLATYTRALGFAGIWGTITMVEQWVGVLREPGDPGGVDGNRATLVYSVFMSVWSVIFLSVWKRKEAEHSFLWGSEGFEDSQKERPEFKGILVVNKETGREDLVEGRPLMRALKKFFSVVVIFLCMFATVMGAFVAVGFKNKAPKKCNPDNLVTHELLASCTYFTEAKCPGGGVYPADCEGAVPVVPSEYWPGSWSDFDTNCCYDMEDAFMSADARGCDHPSFFVAGSPDPNCVDAEGYEDSDGDGFHDSGPGQAAFFGEMGAGEKNKWKMISAACNLVVIQGAGAIYEVIATWLNDLENYRTETEYSDGQIQKNFAFQFINNYFVLFYIAYLRQINLPSWGVSGKTCPESCLSEIQLQMIVVFSLKTFGLQLVELAKPFIAKYITMLKEVSNLNKMVAQAGDMMDSAAAAAGSAVMTEEMRKELVRLH